VKTRLQCNTKLLLVRTLASLLASFPMALFAQEDAVKYLARSEPDSVAAATDTFELGHGESSPGRRAAPTSAVMPTEINGSTEASSQTPAGAERKDSLASRPRRRPAAGLLPRDKESRATDQAEEAGDFWKPSDALLQRLAPFAAMGTDGRWAIDADRLLRELAAAEKTDAVDPLLGGLRESLALAAATTALIPDPSLRTELRHTGHALQRHIDVWRGVSMLKGEDLTEDDLPFADPQTISGCLDQIEKLTADTPEGAAWREYIFFDQLRAWDDNREEGARLPRDLARRVARRMSSPSLSATQRKVLSSEPMAELLGELEKSAVEPVKMAELLKDLERYESRGLPSDARLLACHCRHLAMSTNSRHRELAECIEHYYRNANIRFAVSEELLNRLIPKRDPEYAPVNDTVMGHSIRGRSLTSTNVAVELQPDPNRVMMALKINGHVNSMTHSDSGMAVFYNNNEAGYTATKPLRFDLDGIHLQPAEISVYSNTQLSGLKTGLDSVPLFGSLAKGIARSQHEQKRKEAAAEIKGKVARKARQRIDSESQERLGKVSDNLKHRVIVPLDAMLLSPSLVDAETTEQRFNMRLRIAGEDQLGANTPRPWAPSNSLASMQIHQSAVNNLLDRLNLAGRTLTMPELAEHIGRRLQLAKTWETNPAHDDVKITFARKDPMVVGFQDGRATITLLVARMSKSPRVWKNFRLRVVYCPRVESDTAQLVREGVIHLKGKRLSMGSQIALRAVFSKTFSERRPLPLSPPRLATDPRLSDLRITQVAIDDGWLGIALGPGRTASRPLPIR